MPHGDYMISADEPTPATGECSMYMAFDRRSLECFRVMNWWGRIPDDPVAVLMVKPHGGPA